MNAHEVTFRQAPGWWPSLVQAVCSCGWHGPVRNANDARERILLKLDKTGHLRPARAGHGGGCLCPDCYVPADPDAARGEFRRLPGFLPGPGGEPEVSDFPPCPGDEPGLGEGGWPA